MRYFTTAPSPFQNRRSALSPRAALPAEQPAVPAAPRYTDEQHLALCAWASAKLREASAREQLETLRHYPGLEPVWQRSVQRALDSGHESTLRAELAVLWAKCERLREARRRLRQHVPGFYSLVVC